MGMRLDPKETRHDLKALREHPAIVEAPGPRQIIDDAIAVITQLSAELRRAGFIDYSRDDD